MDQLLEVQESAFEDRIHGLNLLIRLKRLSSLSVERSLDRCNSNDRLKLGFYHLKSDKSLIPTPLFRIFYNH